MTLGFPGKDELPLLPRQLSTMKDKMANTLSEYTVFLLTIHSKYLSRFRVFFCNLNLYLNYKR